MQLQFFSTSPTTMTTSSNLVQVLMNLFSSLHTFILANFVVTFYDYILIKIYTILLFLGGGSEHTVDGHRYAAEVKTFE